MRRLAAGGRVWVRALHLDPYLNPLPNPNPNPNPNPIIFTPSPAVRERAGVRVAGIIPLTLTLSLKGEGVGFSEHSVAARDERGSQSHPKLNAMGIRIPTCLAVAERRRIPTCHAVAKRRRISISRSRPIVAEAHRGRRSAADSSQLSEHSLRRNKFTGGAGWDRPSQNPYATRNCSSVGRDV
jgi:hypothetical protein